MEQNFAYEKRENGICILRCYGSSAQVVIPERLGGYLVTELSDYAFAEVQDKEPENTSGYPCICGRKLEKLVLPKTIRRLGRYIFYNCTCLRHLSFYSNLAFIGAGAFTGCENLSELELYWLEGRSCLREILQDLKQKVTVDFYREQTECAHSLLCRLVYPEFFEEAVENTPARIISTQTHGMGIQYRNAFRNTQVIFSEYDKLFEAGKYNIDFINIVEMALARLRYPYELGEQERESYQQWLLEHLQKAAEMILEQEKIEDLRWLAEKFISKETQVDLLLEEAKLQQKPEAVSILMDLKHQRFPGKKKRFAL